MKKAGTNEAAIYARYFSERQTEQSVEGQGRECLPFTKAKNITVIDVYVGSN
jgi:hypothetical protein